MRGVGASPGKAVGAAHRIADCRLQIAHGLQTAEGSDAASALEATADRFDELAASVSGAEAEILAASAMMARDPALVAATNAEVAKGKSLPEALVDATEGFAKQLEAIDD